jgi:hypothetical protein
MAWILTQRRIHDLLAEVLQSMPVIKKSANGFEVCRLHATTIRYNSNIETGTQKP